MYRLFEVCVSIIYAPVNITLDAGTSGAAGYLDSRNFRKNFKETYDMAPLDYRKKQSESWCSSFPSSTPGSPSPV